MSIKNTLIAGATTAFSVLASLVQDGIFRHVSDTFTGTTSTDYSVRVLFDTFEGKDVQFLPFSKLIQPTDVMGLILGATFPDLRVSTQDVLIVGSTEYAIVAHSVDPAGAIYTFLLRSV